MLSVNAALNGLSAGVVQKLRGGSFQDGFARGALGGGITYAGKRISVGRWNGAGLVGREIAAVGGSITRNAAEGRSTLDELIFPLGFVRLRVDPGAESPVRATLDLHGFLWTAYAVLSPELEWDAGASLSAGAPVFRAPGRIIDWAGVADNDGLVLGFAPAGTILLSDDPLYRERMPTTFAHERVHVLQYDQLFFTVGSPLQRWIAPKVPGGETASRYVDIDLAAPFVYGMLLVGGEHSERAWEREAYFFARP